MLLIWREGRACKSESDNVKIRDPQMRNEKRAVGERNVDAHISVVWRDANYVHTIHCYLFCLIVHGPVLYIIKFR